MQLPKGIRSLLSKTGHTIGAGASNNETVREGLKQHSKERGKKHKVVKGAAAGAGAAAPAGPGGAIKNKAGVADADHSNSNHLAEDMENGVGAKGGIKGSTLA